MQWSKDLHHTTRISRLYEHLGGGYLIHSLTNKMAITLSLEIHTFQEAYSSDNR